VNAAGPVRGSAFGFDFESAFVFDTLRPARGLPRLQVTAYEGGPAGGELVADIAQPGFEARIFRDGVDFSLWVEKVGWFRVDPAAARVEAPVDADPFEREELVLGVPALLCFLQRGDASLHASAVEIDGRVFLFAGPQARGKSTLAAAFARRGYRVLSEDLACIRLGRPSLLLPGAASLRLRNDVAAAVGHDFRCIREGRQRTRYALAGDGAPTPVGGIILLSESESDISLESVSPVRALPELWQASFRLTRAHERRSFAAIATLAEQVSIHRLRRPLRFDGLDATVDAVVSTFSGRAEAPSAVLVPVPASAR
jgi:hypothetical protein